MVIRHSFPGRLANFGRPKKAKPNSMETLPNNLLHRIARERAPGEQKRWMAVFYSRDRSAVSTMTASKREGIWKTHRQGF
jgi:hypothetical protein